MSQHFLNRSKYALFKFASSVVRNAYLDTSGKKGKKGFKLFNFIFI